MRIKIKTRILAMVILLLVILAGNSIWAVFSFQSLKNSIGNIMQANYHSIEVGQEMEASLERQDSAVLSNLFTGNREDAVSRFRENEKVFLKNLGRAEDNVTEPGEDELLKKLNSAYFEYLDKFTTFLQLGVGDKKPYYYEEMIPVLDECKARTRELIELNQKGMLTRRSNTEHMAASATFSVTAVAGATIFVGLIVAVVISNRIIVPLNDLITKMKRIEEGDYSHQIQVSGADEIAVLAQEYNTMAEQLRLYAQMNFDQLMNEKQKAEAIVEGISDGVIVTDEEHRVVVLNHAAEKALGIRERDALGRHILETIKREELFKIIEACKTNKKDEKGFTDLIIIHEGVSNYYRATAGTIGDPKQKESGTVILLQDITKLKEIDAMKSDLVATVSHEFRTPLTSVQMAANLLIEEHTGALNQNQKDLVTSIQEEASRLASLVTGLLDLSKIESGKMHINLERCNLSDIVSAAVKPFIRQLNDRKINVEVETDASLPRVRADANKIIWVVSNLIGNAVRFVSDDGSGRIRIYAEIIGQEMTVSVQDNGPGIPEEDREIIFEKFMQGSGARSKSGSAGLGLAISKQIINAHNGRIWVESTEGVGSTFCFTLKV